MTVSLKLSLFSQRKSYSKCVLPKRRGWQRLSRDLQSCSTLATGRIVKEHGSNLQSGSLLGEASCWPNLFFVVYLVGGLQTTSGTCGTLLDKRYGSVSLPVPLAGS